MECFKVLLSSLLLLRIDTTFEREPPRFQSVAVEAEYKFVNGHLSNGTMATVDWATQQALIVEDIYAGTTEWMSPPLAAQANI